MRRRHRHPRLRRFSGRARSRTSPVLNRFFPPHTTRSSKSLILRLPPRRRSWMRSASISLLLSGTRWSRCFSLSAKRRGSSGLTRHRKRLRTTIAPNGRKRIVDDDSPNRDNGEVQTPRVKDPPPRGRETPPPVSNRDALKARYIEVLIEKAATSDDDKLLDRIEALLREDERKD